ncbi:hypothetical protein SAMN05216388_10533 [Halorientalis persicus]|uniref:Uncharacterized protein n=1 Tax=Halorientalis persicus TaxID=1367881 RepID=A0A1H8WA07_9EURY|nr:hypothetical protein [Halorientalis persicus]SEP24484.1 hypothetical protein SAMN05216388_10533 [Halorientalis persicus]
MDKTSNLLRSTGNQENSSSETPETHIESSAIAGWANRAIIGTVVLVAFLSVFSGVAAAQQSGFICDAAPNSLVTLVQQGSRLFVSVAALGMGASYVISLGSESMPLLNQEQEQKFKRMRGNSLRTFMKLIVGLVGLQIVFSALGILGCMNFIPI